MTRSPGVWDAHSKFRAWSTPLIPCVYSMDLLHVRVCGLIYMTTAVQEGAFTLPVSFDRLLCGSHLLNFPHVLPLQVPKRFIIKIYPFYTLPQFHQLSLRPCRRKCEAVKDELQAFSVQASVKLSILFTPIALCLRCYGSESFAEAVYVPCYVHVFTTSVGRCVVFWESFLTSLHPDTQTSYYHLSLY